MEDEKFSIEQLMLAWKEEYGVTRTSDRGKEYLEIPRNNRGELFRHLYATLKAYGYTYKEMIKPAVCYTLATMCWSDLIVKISDKDIQKQRKDVIETWQGIVLKAEVDHVKNTAPKKVEKELPPAIPHIVETKEELPSLEEALRPVKYIQDDPKFNTSKLPPIQVNESLLARLNALKTTLGDKK